MALDDVSFTTNISIHSGGDSVAPYRYAAFLDTGYYQPLIRRDVLGRMALVGATSSACERPSSPRSLGGFWRNFPFMGRDLHPPERPTFARKRTDVLSRSVVMRSSSTGQAAHRLAGPR